MTTQAIAVAAPPFPPAIADAVKASVESTFRSICGAPPRLAGTMPPPATCSSVVATISFVGDVGWALSLVLPETTAPVLAQKFAGFAIPFESSDMGDAAGELANVLAGSVVAALDARRIKVKLSLPSVTRGHDMQLLTRRDLPALVLHFETAEGAFLLGLVSGNPS